MAPLFRLGLGAFVGNPLSGYIMTIKLLGRKSGKTLHVPVNYAIVNGEVYCVSGFGQGSQWFRNLLANPQVELIMPGGTVTALAETVPPDDQRLAIIRKILINAGFAGYFVGANPRTISDPDLDEATADYPLIRFKLKGLGNGPGDPGGWLGYLVIALHVGLLAWLVGRRRKK
jgi:deazaflavin-dependent oxidoreductase (nitroreductase family)